MAKFAKAFDVDVIFFITEEWLLSTVCSVVEIMLIIHRDSYLP